MNGALWIGFQRALYSYENAFKVDLQHDKVFAKYNGKNEFPISLESEKFELSIILSNESTEEEYVNF